MLPIKSPLQIYALGLEGLRLNVGPVIVYLVLTITINTLSNYIFITYSPQDAQPLFIEIVNILISISYFYIGALLIYALHATYLSSGKRRGIAILKDLESINRIAWRSIIIIFATAILSLSALAVISLFGDNIWSNISDPNQPFILTDHIGIILLIGIYFIISLVFFGLRIPHIVFKGWSEKDVSGFRTGWRQLPRLLQNMMLGPVLYAGAVFFISIIFDYGKIRLELGLLNIVSIFMNLIYFLLHTYAISMTAVVLSDAYLVDRREWRTSKFG